MKQIFLFVILCVFNSSAYAADWSGGVSFGLSIHQDNFKEMLEFVEVNYKTEQEFNREVIYWDSAADETVQKIQNLAYDGSIDSKISVLRRLGEDRPEYISFLILHANAGDPVAQYYLGLEYIFGRNISTDHLAARNFFELSIDENKGDSAYMLSQIYEFGLGVEVSQEKTRQYIEYSANLLSVTGMCKLANSIKNGVLGYDVDELLAQSWEQKAVQTSTIEGFSCDIFFK